jgi:hypothetical protein
LGRRSQSPCRDGVVMIEGVHHAACVDAWLKSTNKASRQVLIQLFETAVAVLWDCAAVTLGDVTLTAIADRVLQNVAAKFPPFASITIEPSKGLRFDVFRKSVESMSDASLRSGIRLVLVKFLTVLGNLTDDILTTELHFELSKITERKPRRNGHKGKDKTP